MATVYVEVERSCVMVTPNCVMDLPFECVLTHSS